MCSVFTPILVNFQLMRQLVIKTDWRMKHKWHLLQSRNECFTLLDKASDMNQILRGKTAHQNKVSKVRFLGYVFGLYYIDLGFIDLCVIYLTLLHIPTPLLDLSPNLLGTMPELTRQSLFCSQPEHGPTLSHQMSREEKLPITFGRPRIEPAVLRMQIQHYQVAYMPYLSL